MRLCEEQGWAGRAGKYRDATKLPPKTCSLKFVAVKWTHQGRCATLLSL